jgi:hypothetical protein
MNPAQQHVESILRQWKGEDAGDQHTPSEIAAMIDQEYAQYIASLPEKTAAIQAGQAANERRVA